jgi:hypothetical protein
MQADDPRIEKLLNEKPLLAFSCYTEGQVGELKRQARQILDAMDSSIKVGTVEFTGFGRAHWGFWLWTLGAFEVVRTMKQARACLSAELNEKIVRLQRQLVEIRVPFAKQEIAGKKKPIGSEASVSGFDGETHDMFYSINGEKVSVRKLLTDFVVIFDGITLADILSDHRYSYKPPADPQPHD